jgi:pilus assembly protein CpaB
MKPARIIVLVIALAAGAIAALLAGRSDQEAPPPAPVAQLETVEVLVANSDIGVGTKMSAQEMRWQTWPAASASAQFIRKNERPEAIEQLSGSITRQTFAAGEPIRESRLIKAVGRRACGPSPWTSRRNPAWAASSFRTITSTSS